MPSGRNFNQIPAVYSRLRVLLRPLTAVCLDKISRIYTPLSWSQRLGEKTFLKGATFD